MVDKALQKAKVWFLVLVGVVFANLALTIAISNMHIPGPFVLVGHVAFLIIAVVTFVFAWKIRSDKKLRKLLLVNSGCAAGFPVLAVLHNLVYGLMIVIFGENFWGADGDEPVLFMLAFLCLFVFLVTAVWILVILIRRKIMEKKTKKQKRK